MGIEKEREAFEQHLTDTGLVEFSDYGFAVDECDEYLHEPTQVAWDSWLIGLNRAKAVPEGFVLVNKKDLVKVLNCVTDDWLVDTDSFEEFKKIESLVQDEVNAMIEPQEPAND